MKQIMAFPPIIQKNCRVLILGSMPGVQSLEAQQYYAHPQNQFWKIIERLFDRPLPPDYDSRTTFLLEQHIALWDVIHSCYREGSLDSAIRQETAHDFETFFHTYPGIRFVAFNGTKAQDTFRKHVGAHFPGITFHRLPSTSPAHTMKLAEKLAEWQIIARMASEDKGCDW
ncbi:MAG: DNA-deoxyinosine glycosylase [Bacillota bacterium]|nr:DNA-deoxyinosine glycosylase [Bacillota bacterium]MDW7676112.1 DNA-deoxyinosine glycosylase [Bacillota bacterium]